MVVHQFGTRRPRSVVSMRSLSLSTLMVLIVCLSFQSFFYIQQQSQHEQQISRLTKQQQQWLWAYHNYKTPPLPLRNDNNSTFSACLVIMDDNHFLIEWLTYHYFMLPLRYLIVTVDPRSTKQSPTQILNRFRQSIDNNSINKSSLSSAMTIVRWNEWDFMPLEWLKRPPPNERDGKAKFIRHRERQRHFYPKCMAALSLINRTWTTIIDIDEFIVPNRHYHEPSTTKNGITINTVDKFKQPQQRNQQQNRKVIDIVQNEYNSSWACIMMPRVRFGTHMDNSATTIQSIPTTTSSKEDIGLLDPQLFMTLKWTYRAPLELRKLNRNPKSIIDVSKITNRSLFARYNTDAHRPVRTHCPQKHLYTKNNDSHLVVHHYPPISLEQFLFRNDARQNLSQRNLDTYQSMALIQHAKDTSITPWIHNLIDTYGYHQAHQWLKGVGNISYQE